MSVATAYSRQCACTGGSHTASGDECEACRPHHPGTRPAATGSAWRGIAPPIVHEVLRSPGAPLGATTRAEMEPRLGHDFTRVRVHADTRAAAEREATAGPGPDGGVISRTPLQISRQIDPMPGRAPAGSERRRPAGSPPSYREARELADCLRIMGSEASAYCRQTVLGHAPAPPPIRIERVGGEAQSFISTDRITLTVGSAGPVDWTVHGVSANAGDGNPHRATNRAQFSFRPNPTRRPTTGSRAPNDPIEYRVEAGAGSRTAAFELIQDEADIIRQEYIDLGPARPPGRDRVVTPGMAMFNTGNYSLIVDGGMDAAFTGTETEFQALTPVGSVAPAIGVSSGYRNPRRNVAVGSQFPVTSRHVLGTALDLTVPAANATLWTRLRAAGANAGNGSICERGPTQVPCTDPTVDHVHIQW